MGIFTTPVGGAAFLGFVFSLIGLYLLVLYILDSIKSVSKRYKSTPTRTHTIYNRPLTKEEFESIDRQQDWMVYKKLCREFPSNATEWRKSFDVKWGDKKENSHTQTHSFKNITIY